MEPVQVKESPTRKPYLAEVLKAVHDEFRRAEELFQGFKSDHEGLGVIREEYLELEKAICWGTKRDQAEEAIQLAAMAVRHLIHRSTQQDLKIAEDRIQYKFEKKLAKRREQSA